MRFGRNDSPMTYRQHWTIATTLHDLTEGIFGHIVLYMFELLPYLDKAGIEPTWELHSRLYGSPPSFVVIPGIFDAVPTADSTPSSRHRRKSFLILRAWHRVALGNDWTYLNALWTKYFRVPPRVEAAADALGLTRCTLGLHYRGTDKASALWDTNFVAQTDFLTLVDDFIARHPTVDGLFIATDEPSFIAAATLRFPGLPVINTGAAAFHKATGEAADPGFEKADHAVLDCVLLSRCTYVLNCSSALSAFAKVLNPKLQIQRVAASKMFDVMPYFPIAYIPCLTSSDPVCASILERQLAGDWTHEPDKVALYGATFRTRSISVANRLYRLYRFARTRLKQGLILGGWIRESASLYR